MRRRPLLALAVGFAAGAAWSVPFPQGKLAAVAIGAGVTLAISPLTAPVAFAVAGWGVGASVRASAQGVRAEATTIEGRVVSVPERFEDRARFALREDRGTLLLASTRQLPWPIALGDRLRFEARLRFPERQRNPGGRDRASDLARRGIAVEAHATAMPVRMAPPSPLASIEAGRDRFAAALAGAMPPREAALVRAVATGDRSAVDPATNEAFARSGLAHLLSVSGLHLAVVALGTYRVARWLLARWEAVAVRLEPRRAAACIAIPVAALYALATGADVPVVRSALAAAVGFGGVLLDREVDSLNVLALAGLTVLAFDPGALVDISFQLSFASVAGLALWSGPLRNAIPIAPVRTTLLGRAREALLSAVCASAAATVATAPIVAVHFRRVSLVGVFSNVAGVPLGSALTVVAALAALTSTIAPALTPWLLAASRPLASLLLAVNDAAAAVRWASIGIGSPGAVGALLCYAALACAWRMRRLLRASAVAIAVVALLAPPHVRHALAHRRGGLEVTFLSVGQGDATAFLLPDGSTVLVDGGGEAQGHYDPGARDIVPWLRDAGVRHVAAVFLSHPHPDHVLGLPAIAAAFPIEHFFTNGRVGDEVAASAFARLPEPEALRAGNVFERAGVRFEVLGPPSDSEGWEDNDVSLVLRVTHGSVRFLLCGDIEHEGESALLAGDGVRSLPADVVKVPHHGSLTSSSEAFVTATHPAYAIATVARDNRFGFPAPEIVARWRSSGAEVVRTDEGAIRFVSNGQTLRRTPPHVSLDALALARERL